MGVCKHSTREARDPSTSYDGYPTTSWAWYVSLPASFWLYLAIPIQDTNWFIGKTAPRLISDLLDYDRRFLKRNGRNLLADPAQHFTGEWILRKGKNDCRHSLTRKDTQMRGPTGREMPNEAPHYVVATYCAKCRHHFKITVSFAAQEHGQKPCSLSDENNRMHHLRLVESMFQPLDKRKLDDHKYEYFAEGHQFRCSGMGCPVVVEILISPPRLDKDDMNRLLDPGLVRARGQKEIENDPVRMENEKPVTAATALGYLRSYINDARNGKLDSKTGKPSRIAMRNKKYRLGFSDEFHDLFRYLDFVNVVDPPTEVVSILPLICRVHTACLNRVMANQIVFRRDRFTSGSFL